MRGGGGVEKEYRSLVSRIAALSLIHFCLWFSLSFAYSYVTRVLLSDAYGERLEIYSDLSYAIVYTVSLLVTIRFAKIFMGMDPSRDLKCAPTSIIVPAAFVSVAVVFAASVVGSLFTSSVKAFEVFGEDTTATITPASFLVKLLVLVVLPAFLEEILFRGVILKSLIPHGKTSAIFLSALLFALIHRHPTKFVYSFAGGIVIGYFVTEYSSIWIGILVHAINNLIALVSLSVYNICSEKVYAAYNAALSILIFGGALVAMPILILKANKKEEQEHFSISSLFAFLRSPLMLLYFLFSIIYMVYIII